MFKEKAFVVVLLCSVLLVSAVSLQLLYPTMSFLDGGLVTVVLLTILVKEDVYTYAFGSLSLLLTIGACFYPVDGVAKEEVAVEHIFPGIIIVISALSVLYVKKLYRSMESEERQLNALFEFATEGIILTDQQGRILLANPAALNLFGYEKHELIRKPVEILIPSKYALHHHKNRESFHAKPSNRTMGNGRDLFALTKNGTELPVEISLSYYKQKSETYVIAFIVDITQRKQSEAILLDQRKKLEKITEDVKKLNTELEDKVEQRTLILKETLHQLETSQQELSDALQKEKDLNEIKSRFVSMASHEFRTPLSTVLSSAALIGRYQKAEEQPQRDKHIQKIKDAVKHLNDLLEDFLSLGKLEEGKVEAQCSLFDAKAFSQEVLDELMVIKKEAQSLELQYQGQACFHTDKRLLKNIILNLVSNAIKFSNQDGRVVMSIENKGNFMEMTVSDNGIGISEQDQAHLFSSFFRGGNAINIQGTGLGLHIVKRYLDILKGAINVKSEIGVGTTFLIYLPSREAGQTPETERIENFS